MENFQIVKIKSIDCENDFPNKSHLNGFTTI